MAKLDELIKKVEKLYDDHNFNEIVNILDEKVLNDFKDSTLYAWCSRAQNHLKYYDKALEYAEESIKLDTNNYLGYLARGVALSIFSKYEESLLDINKAIQLNPDYADSFNQRGITSYKNKDLAQALIDFEKAIELDPTNAQAYFNRGTVYYNSNEYENAILDFNLAIELDPGYSEVYINRGTLFYNKREFDKAISDYDKAIEIVPNYSIAFLNRGILYLNTKDYDKAISDFNKVIELDSNSAYAYFNRGVAYHYQEEYDKALKDYDKSIELDPVHANTYFNRGVLFANKNDQEKALVEYNKALEIDPQYVNAYINRGSVYYDNKEYEKAIQDFNEALKLDSEYVEWLDNQIKLAKEKLESERKIDETGAQSTDIETRAKVINKIEEIVNTIRDESRSDVKTVVHYTKLFVAEKIITEDQARLNYSNAIYMNDPMEGKILFEYFNDKSIEEAYLNGEKRNETSVYLGSFLPAEDDNIDHSHEDDLVMWRTYGKNENGKEAAGCSIVINSQFFTKSKKEDNITANDKDEGLLNVIYIRKENNNRKIVNDETGNIDKALRNLKDELTKLIELRNKYNPEDYFYKDIENVIFLQLSEIAYLYKSADYNYERETRVIRYIPRNSNEIKYYESSNPGAPKKKFYIQSSNEVLPHIEKIIIGPKVEHYQQWSLYFDYEIRQMVQKTPSESKNIEIIKSECKFQ